MFTPFRKNEAPESPPPYCSPVKFALIIFFTSHGVGSDWFGDQIREGESLLETLPGSEVSLKRTTISLWPVSGLASLEDKNRSGDRLLLPVFACCSLSIRLRGTLHERRAAGLARSALGGARAWGEKGVDNSYP
jgi:hypothetical protein